MTSAGPVEGEHTAWDGESSAVQDLRDLLVPLAPEGALRIVLQRLALHESSRPVGEHEVVDVVAGGGRERRCDVEQCSRVDVLEAGLHREPGQVRWVACGHPGREHHVELVEAQALELDSRHLLVLGQEVVGDLLEQGEVIRAR